MILFLLTVLFTCSTVFALLLRKKLHGGAGQLMYSIWLAVMLASLLPLQIAPPTLRVIVSEREVAEALPPYRDRQPGIMMIADAAHEIRSGDLPGIRAQLYEAKEPMVSDCGDAIAFNLSSVTLAAAHLLLFVWALGMSYCMMRELLEYREIRQYLKENSDPCSDLRLLSRFESCKAQLGIRGNIPLRRLAEGCPTTPCVVGFFRPTVYLSAFCDDLDSSHLENIFTHELCHIKRRDMFYKLLSVLTTSVHWFNPAKLLFRQAVAEDCEMACDATVLRRRRATAVRDYMESILTVAERVRRERRGKHGQNEPMFRAAFFMANDTAPNYLKRRYLHMKTTREQKNRRRFCTIFACALACIMLGNVALLSSCSYVEAMDTGAHAADHTAYSGDPVEIALANHFCVPSFSDITEEQLAEIETLALYLVTPQEDAPDAVYVSVNGMSVEPLLPCILTRDVFEDSILPRIDALESDAESEDFIGKKFRAFYCIKDPSDPQLEPEAVAEMLALFPITKTAAAVFYDPYTTPREEAILYAWFCEAGLINEAAFSVSALQARLQSIPALDGADVSVTQGNDLAALGLDGEDLHDAGQPYQAYMSAYIDSLPAADGTAIADQEYDQQIDINGNGIIGQ